MQVTAGALTGMFGPRAEYWGEKFVGDGYTHILATDAHSNQRRIPCLSEGLAVAERLLGRNEAARLVFERPQAIIDNLSPDAVTPLPPKKPQLSWLSNLRHKANLLAQR